MSGKWSIGNGKFGPLMKLKGSPDAIKINFCQS